MQYPDRFTALIPVMGYYGWPYKVPDNICDLKDVPIWAFHGEEDERIPVEAQQILVEALEAYSGNAQITAFLNTYHDINDKPFYTKALRHLEESGEKTGFSISQAKGPSSCEFNFDELGFVQMGAVVEDHGPWEDFADYMTSARYIRMNRMQSLVFPMIANMSNQNIERIRTG